MSALDPVQRPDPERPIDLTDVPDHPGPTRVIEHHPDDNGMPGEPIPTPGPDTRARS
jgi:hypothetical protein